MIASVRVMARASHNRVIQEEGRFKVYLTKPACEGMANAQLISLLSVHLRVKKYQIRIIKGEKSRDKLVEINA